MKKAFLLLFIPTWLSAQISMNDHQKKIFSQNGSSLLYNILYPLNYESSKRYPIITLLHGSGERGNDNSLQLKLKLGGDFFKNAINKDGLQAIVIFPQCPVGDTWRKIIETQPKNGVGSDSIVAEFQKNPTTPSLLTKRLLDSLRSNNIADPRRMYIGGISMGGFGTFDMIERYPDYFAAAFPICGGGDPEMAHSIASKVAIWIFHGDLDGFVDVNLSRQYFQKLKALESKVNYTEYKGVGHNCWDNVFMEKQLIPWLMSKQVQ